VQHPGGQENNGAEESEKSFHGDSERAKWKRQQPDEGVEHQRQKRKRPAEDEKNKPEDESEHRCFPVCSSSIYV
jgi:hypothetical protein